jgi:hypothetical protein
MEAPIRIQAPHHPYLFRGHSYPNDLYSTRNRDGRDSNMPHYPSQPYDSARSDSLPHKGSDHRAAPPTSTGSGRDAGNRDDAVLDSRILPHHLAQGPSQPQASLPTRAYEYTMDQPRIPVSQLVEENSNVRRAHSPPHSSPYHQHSSSSPMASHRSHDQDVQRVELPGVDQVRCFPCLFLVSFGSSVPLSLSSIAFTYKI